MEEGLKVDGRSIASYNETNSTLTLTHHFPLDGPAAKAIVDVQLVLSTREDGLFTRGNWVNVLGYISNNNEEKKTRSKKNTVKVEALTVWSVGPTFDLAKYERTVVEMIAMHKNGTKT